MQILKNAIIHGENKFETIDAMGHMSNQSGVAWAPA